MASKKFHINYRGEPTECKPRFGGCPGGGEKDHFPTAEAALAAYVKSAEAVVNRQKQTQPVKQAKSNFKNYRPDPQLEAMFTADPIQGLSTWKRNQKLIANAENVFRRLTSWEGEEKERYAINVAATLSWMADRKARAAPGYEELFNFFGLSSDSQSDAIRAELTDTLKNELLQDDVTVSTICRNIPDLEGYHNRHRKLLVQNLAKDLNSRDTAYVAKIMLKGIHMPLHSVMKYYFGPLKDFDGINREFSEVMGLEGWTEVMEKTNWEAEQWAIATHFGEAIEEVSKRRAHALGGIDLTYSESPYEQLTLF